MSPIVRGVGTLLHIPALMALLSLPVCLVFGEGEGLRSLGITALCALALGQALFWASRGAAPAQRYHSLQIAAIAWLTISLLGALPFFISAVLHPGPEAGALAVFHSPWHAIFESVSGFTSTGLTVVELPSELPRHLQWWRSFTEWVGGIGVVLLLLSVLPADRSALMLYYSEAREEKILPTVASTVRWIWTLYLGLTAAAVLLLLAVGEPFWRALNHGMTAISTGGFSITDNSLGSAPAHVQLAFVPIMIAGALSFLVHYQAWRRREIRKALFGGAEIRLFWLLLVGGIGMLALELHLAGEDTVLLPAVLQTVSALTSSGFATVELSLWSSPTLLLILLAVLVGGMAGSTSGGFKVLRLSVLLHDLRGSLDVRRASPHEVVRLRYDGKRLSPEELAVLARSAALLVGAYLLLWFAGSVVMLHLLPARTELAHVMFDVASALFNSGLSMGIAGADLGDPALALMSLLMLLGRLEIFPMLVLLAWLLYRR